MLVIEVFQLKHYIGVLEMKIDSYCMNILLKPQVDEIFWSFQPKFWW